MLSTSGLHLRSSVALSAPGFCRLGPFHWPLSRRPIDRDTILAGGLGPARGSLPPPPSGPPPGGLRGSVWGRRPPFQPATLPLAAPSTTAEVLLFRWSSPEATWGARSGAGARGSRPNRGQIGVRRPPAPVRRPSCAPIGRPAILFIFFSGPFGPRARMAAGHAAAAGSTTTGQPPRRRGGATSLSPPGPSQMSCWWGGGDAPPRRRRGARIGSACVGGAASTGDDVWRRCRARAARTPHLRRAAHPLVPPAHAPVAVVAWCADPPLPRSPATSVPFRRLSRHPSALAPVSSTPVRRRPCWAVTGHPTASPVDTSHPTLPLSRPHPTPPSLCLPPSP